MSQTSTLLWATVTALSPLRIRLDGDSAALVLTPESLIDPAALAVDDRVRVELYDRRILIVGRAGGPAAATETYRGPVELANAAETAALADGTRAVTPLGLAATVGRITALEALRVPKRFRLEWKGSAFTGGANMKNPTTTDDPAGGWNNTTGRWTVPLAGIYLFTFRWKSNASGGTVNAELFKGTSSPVSIRRSDNGPTSAYAGGQVADYVNLAAGDELAMRFTANITVQSDTPSENTWWSLIRLGAES